MKYRITKHLWLLALVAPMALWPSDVVGVGIGQVMNSKSLPEATVAVIDPESGTSSGTSGSDVNIAVGDIILFRFAYAPVPDKSTRAMQTYLTEYLPPNTEVVGVRLIDKDGVTIEPRLPGLSVDGCSGGSRCNTYNNLPCNDGADDCDFSAGSVAQVHADTGIFFTTDARLARDPDDAFLTFTNGTQMTAQPSRLTDIDQLLDISAPFFAHNAWDYIQVQGFGDSGAESGSGGDGNPPYLYGSPVAGPQTFYSFEATENGGFGIEFNDVVGPWQRIRYPGSMIGSGDPDMGSSGIVTRKSIPTGTGFDVTPNNPIAGATALRYAVGESRVGTPDFVEVAVRVTGVPIDPNFGASGDNLDCGEVSGSGLSARLSGFEGGMQPQTGSETQWAYYVGSPGCVFLKLKFDIEADRDLSAGTVAYRTFVKNLSVNPETNARVIMGYDGSKLGFVSSDIPADGPPASCSAPFDTGLLCLTWSLGTMNPSDEVEINTNFTTSGGGQISAVMEGRYVSDQLPGGFNTRDVVLIVPIAQPSIVVAPEFDPTTTAVSPGVTNLVGTLSNTGTNNISYEGITLTLPAGWTPGGNISVGASSFPCTSNCATNTPGYDVSLAFAIDDFRAITIPITVPGGTATGLYDVGVELWADQTGGGFGGTFETAFPKAATIPVGAVRTAKPVIDCPIPSTGTEVSGTSEASADVSLKFNLIERGTGTADGAGDWTVNNFAAFGAMYGGLEVRASATAPGKLESELSDSCEVTPTRECSDGIDNDGDGLTDFPADPGCDSPTDNDETDEVLECSDTIDNDGDGPVDFPADLGCYSADDPIEDLNPACSDGIDNDGDGLVDFGSDPDCTDANDIDEVGRPQCMDGIDNDGDGDTDFPADAFCNSAFDDDEFDVSPPPDIKARLLIVFDTSGSMNFNTCDATFTGGDGSTECPGNDVLCADCASADCGNGLPDDSRMAIVKTGINNVIAGFGEVEYGLMRFHQRGEQFDVPDDCPGQNASLQSGGWQGGGAAPCDGGFNAGDLLVGFSFDNHTDLLNYMDGDSNYPGDPPAGLDQELRGSGTTPLGGALTSALSFLSGVESGDPASGCRPYRVILVTDGGETCGGDPDSAAAALNAAGFPVHVIGFATSDAGIVASLDSIANNGGTGTAIIASDAAALSAAMADIIDDTLLVEKCNGLDDDCDVLVDEDFPTLGDTCDNGELGVCLTTGDVVCTADETGVECDASPGVPGTEICDGLDNNCNGLVDEGFPVGCGCTPTTEVCNGTDDDCDGVTDEDTAGEPLPGVCTDCCGVDIGECTFGDIECNSGTLECVGGTPPATDVCNGLDDDCDTLVDEFTEQCYEFASGCDVGAGTCDGLCRIGLRSCLSSGDAGFPGIGECIGDVGPAGELCNGLDDDCDGVIDNGFDVGDACDNGQMGACLVMGTKQCLSDGSGTFCTAFPVTPGTEVCNCLDDDCDGTTDEALGAPIGSPCGGGTACTGGTLECDPVACAPSCEGAVGGTAETCNAIDDDCDSIIDEDVPGEGIDCTDPGFEAIGDTGECEFGVTQCIGGMIICVDYEGPKPETCNGVDDNCDGMVDNEAICPSPEDICVESSCLSPCELGEFPCPFGFLCRTFPEGEFCVEDPCLDVVCPSGEVCNSDTGACEDPCDLITCPGPDQTCFLGGCFDCFDSGFDCEEDELCTVHEGTGTGQCVDNLCFEVTCDADQFCDTQTGECVDLVCDPPCAAGERCDEGTCVPDPCDGVSCPGGQLCNPETGRCVGNPCAGVMCPQGEACNPGNGLCEPDPCIGINCPEGFECRTNFDGDAECVPPVIEEGDKVFAAGGGCACDVGSDGGVPGSSAVMFLIALVWLRRRRT